MNEGENPTYDESQATILSRYIPDLTHTKKEGNKAETHDSGKKQRETGTGSLQQPVYKTVVHPGGSVSIFYSPTAWGAFALNPN